MNRLLAFRASEPERLRTVLRRHPGALPGAAPSDKTPVPGEEAPPRREGSLRWGVGLYVGGEPLLQRFTDEASRGAAAASELRTDYLLAQSSRAPDAAPARPATEPRPAGAEPVPASAQSVPGGRDKAPQHPLAPPLRYRRFLFAVQGDLSQLGRERAALRAGLPQPLHANLRGDGDEELLFHALLARMHEADPSYLEDPQLRVEVAVAALGQILLSAGSGPQHAVLGNGTWLVAARRGSAPLWYRALVGLGEGGDEADDGFRAVLAFADLGGPTGGAGLTELPDGHALVIGPDVAFQIVPLLP